MTPAALDDLGLGRPELELVALVLTGLALLVALQVFGKLSVLLPMSRPRRELWRRAQPILALCFGAGYAAFALRVLLRHTGVGQLIGVAVVLMALLAASWSGIRDVVAGMTLKVGRSCGIGELVKFGEYEGRVERLGLRTLTLETRHGERAVIPYSRVINQPLFKTPVIQGSVLYLFRVQASAGSTTTQVRRAILERALCCHWSSATRAPEIKSLGGGEYEVTVFALHADYAPEIEAYVRRAPILADA